MYREVFEELGLSPNEAKIYEFLINNREASVPGIAIDIKVDKRNIYDAIPRLLHKGLVYQIAGGKENKYSAVEPAKLLELIREKEARLLNVLPELTEKYKKNSSKEMVYIYKGTEGIKNYLRDALKVGKDLYFIGGKGGWFDKKISDRSLEYFLDNNSFAVLRDQIIETVRLIE